MHNLPSCDKPASQSHYFCPESDCGQRDGIAVYNYTAPLTICGGDGVFILMVASVKTDDEAH